MNALGWLRKHEAGIAVLVGVACFFGAFSLPALPSALYPEVVFPRVIIVGTLPGASARTMQLSVTRPVEEGVTSILGVRKTSERRSKVPLSVSRPEKAPARVRSPLPLSS